MKQKFFALLAVAIMLLTLAAGCGGSSSSSSGDPFRQCQRKRRISKKYQQPEK